MHMYALCVCIITIIKVCDVCACAHIIRFFVYKIKVTLFALVTLTVTVYK